MQLTIKQKAVLWLIQFVVICACLIHFQLKSPLHLDTDLSALFETNEKTLLTPVTEKIEQQNLNQHIVLVGSKSLDNAIKYADELTQQLNQLESIESAKSNFSELPELNQIISEYLPYKHFLLSERFRQLIQESLQQDSQSQALFGYQFSLLNQIADPSVAATLTDDPTLSLADFLSRPLLTSSGLSRQKDHLVGYEQNKHYVFVSFSSQNTGINIDTAQQLVNELSELTQNDDVDYLYTGAMFYASRSSQTGQFEMMLFGVISTLAILFLIVFSYRSITAIAATLGLITISFVYGYLALSIFYPQINIITLVFSVTLIGISADYSFHALTEIRFAAPGSHKTNQSKNPLSAIYSSLSMSYLTTGAGYGLLLLAPFILFKQIAVFTLFGLLGALLCVFLLYPILTPQIQKLAENENSLSYQARLPNFALVTHEIQKRLLSMILRYKWFSMAIMLIVVSALSLLKFDDNVREYYTPDPTLQQNEIAIKNIIKNKWEHQYFLVQADSIQSLLEKEEQFTPLLNQLVKQNSLADFSAVTSWLPSYARQMENQNLIERALIHGQFDNIQSILAQSDWSVNTSDQWLTPVKWQASHIGKIFRQHLFQIENTHYSIIRLAGIQDLAELNQLAATNNSIVLVDKAGEISSQLEQFRQHLQWVLIAAIIAALMVFSWRYGFKRASMGLIAPIFALCVALIGSYFIQQSLNIFNLVAGILILALGLDYSVFFAEHGFEKKITLTTLLSALSSIFVFAILIFSSMPAINSFGLTVFIGVLITFSLAPIVSKLNQSTN